MATLGGTITTWTVWNPFLDRQGARTPAFTYNQTIVTFTNIRPTTSSRVNVISAPTVAKDFFLTSLMISYKGATAAAGFDVMMGTETIATLNPTSTHTQTCFTLNFGGPGLCGGTTSTMTVSLTPIGATIAAGVVVATGFRKK